MRHKYPTRAIVLSRTPLAEASALLTVLTPELGLVRARAQGLRKSGAKLAHSLQTFTECDAILVRGKEGWRLSGALCVENHFQKMGRAARARAARVAGLILRLVHGEENDAALFESFIGFVAVLPLLSESEQDAAECLAALRILRALGLDAGDLPQGGETYASSALFSVGRRRSDIVGRVNRGITASGL